jgi:hypothetical protein
MSPPPPRIAAAPWLPGWPVSFVPLDAAARKTSVTSDGRTLSEVTRRRNADVEYWVARRVTFDRAVRTKPLAFAADAGDDYGR